jgi:ElaB/YqjD/DUF883 family membrane-anchored ribosome-binding protein
VKAVAAGIERLLGELTQTLTSMEALLAKRVNGATHAAGAPADIQSQIQSVLERASALQGELAKAVTQTARSVDVSVRSNPWGSIAIAAAVGFLLGAALGRRSPEEDTEVRP